MSEDKKESYSYLIASGWWACEKERDTREKLLGDDQIRDISFHALWRHCIDSFSTPQEIVIIDSASPIKPNDVAGEFWVSLNKNYGHSTAHETKLCGVSRSFILSMMYAYVNDYDYWVYVEQDALIYGDNVIDLAIQSAKTGVAMGDGKSTPQPIQQSLMVFRKDRIVEFVYRYNQINALDSEISPEWKFVFALNKLAPYLPSSFLRYLCRRSSARLVRRFKKMLLGFIQIFNDFNYLPFGYGRVRPINFQAKQFYFQHASDEELAYFNQMLNTKNQSD